MSHSLLAKRLDAIEPFRVMAILDRAKAMAAAGRDIVHLEVGEPDFPTAPSIVAAAQQALVGGDIPYAQALGLPELRQIISDFYRSDYGVDVAAERIVITPGASGALLMAVALLINPGDGMLMTDPGYPCNRHFLRLVEGEGQLVPVGPEQRYQLTPALAQQHWRDNTVGVLVASPANPTGEILTRDELTGLVDVCSARGGSLVVDEIYHGLTYGEIGQNQQGCMRATSVLELTDQAFVINSFSKYFGMTGWRLGWMVAPTWALEGLEKLAQNLFIASPTLSQHAAMAAFGNEARLELEHRRAVLGERRDYLLPALRALGFSIPHTPAGALYVYAGIEAFGLDSETFCLKLLDQEGVALTPGTDFGHYRADSHVRFAYTTDLERLREAVVRLERFLAKNTVEKHK